MQGHGTNDGRPREERWPSLRAAFDSGRPLWIGLDTGTGKLTGVKLFGLPDDGSQPSKAQPSAPDGNGPRVGDAFNAWMSGDSQAIMRLADASGFSPGNLPPYLESKAGSCGQEERSLEREKEKKREGEFDSRYQVSCVGCKSRFCPTCCVGMGLRLRKRLLPVLQSFKGIIMLTLTIDPKLFDSPAKAFEYVKEKRSVAELVKALAKLGMLHSRRYFCVIEWQKKTEMPHFHVLLDSSFIEFDAICRIWNRNRPASAGPIEGNRPGFGSVRFSARECQSSEHAANYACKYLIKHPSEGYPDWVLDSQGNIHHYFPSKGFWPKKDKPQADTEDVDAKCPCDECSSGDVVEPGDEEPERMINSKTLRERIAECDSQSVLMRCDTVISADGEILTEQWHWLGKLDCGLPMVARQLGRVTTGERKIEITAAEASFLREESGLIKRQQGGVKPVIKQRKLKKPHRRIDAPHDHNTKKSCGRLAGRRSPPDGLTVDDFNGGKQ